MRTAVELKAVSKRYSDTVALDDVDLRVGEGETVAVLGPNGAGKTTLLSIALGLLGPSSGAARVFGRTPVEALHVGEVGVLLQDSGLLEDVRVEELVATVAGMYPHPHPVKAAMRAADVAELATRRIGRLSGGQQQRVRFALALVGDPKLLVLDEPTVGLDIESRRALWQEVRARTAEGRTVVFATHYLAEADAYADRIVLIAHGRIVADGTSSEIKARMAVRAVHGTLAEPDTEGLGTLPGVTAVEIRDERVKLSTTDSDATVRALLAKYPEARDVEVGGIDLEDVFVALTHEEAR
jgi:ABC-2 type transport system ATP-binding protein